MASQINSSATPFLDSYSISFSLHFVLYFMGLKWGRNIESKSCSCWPEHQPAFLRSGQLISWLEARIAFFLLISSAWTLPRRRANPCVGTIAFGTKELNRWKTFGRRTVYPCWTAPGQSLVGWLWQVPTQLPLCSLCTHEQAPSSAAKSKCLSLMLLPYQSLVAQLIHVNLGNHGIIIFPFFIW
jgi:hypothetical protein